MLDVTRDYGVENDLPLVRAALVSPIIDLIHLIVVHKVL